MVCKFRDVIREAFNVTHEIGEDNSPKSAIDQTELASQTSQEGGLEDACINVNDGVDGGENNLVESESKQIQWITRILSIKSEKENAIKY